MNNPVFTPTKFWVDTAENDLRFEIVLKFIRGIDWTKVDTQDTTSIIHACIKHLRKFILSDSDISTLKDLILSQGQKVLSCCVQKIVDDLHQMTAGEITIISLGCGNRGLFEESIDRATKVETGKSLRWIGTDIADFRDRDSFFINKEFATVPADRLIEFSNLVQDISSPLVLVGRYSFHHLGVEFEEFLQSCRHISKIFLVEEPVTSKKWADPSYRIIRIAFDILANMVISQNWARQFSEDPSKFKINYINSDALPPRTVMTEVKGTFPETSLVAVNLDPKISS